MLKILPANSFQVHEVAIITTVASILHMIGNNVVGETIVIMNNVAILNGATKVFDEMPLRTLSCLNKKTGFV